LLKVALNTITSLFAAVFVSTYAISAYLLKLWVKFPAYEKVYSKPFVIKFVSNLAVGQWFSPWTPVSSSNETESHEIPRYCWRFL